MEQLTTSDLLELYSMWELGISTIGAAFTLPPIVSKIVIDKYGLEKNRAESTI